MSKSAAQEVLDKVTVALGSEYKVELADLPGDFRSYIRGEHLPSTVHFECALQNGIEVDTLVGTLVGTIRNEVRYYIESRNERKRRSEPNSQHHVSTENKEHTPPT